MSLFPVSRFNHRQILQLALPMIISNISTPLLGLVDTAVMGHLDTPEYLAGIALGGLIFSFIFWSFGFLRMGTSGVTAQAYGNQDNAEIKSILGRALFVAVIISILILFLQFPIRSISFQLIESSPSIERLAKNYFDIRIWSTPATLGQYVLLGWFLGLQNVKSPLILVITTNLCNIVLDLLFVVILQMDINGVALASVLAEYFGLGIGIFMLARELKKYPGPGKWAQVFNKTKLKKILLINNNIFIRTLCLIFAFAFFTAQGARIGEVVLAANAVLLNFQMFMAYALDGFAHAAEALVGRAVGARSKKLFQQTISTAALWSFIVAIGFSLLYALFGMPLIRLLTSLDVVRATAYEYHAWIIGLPLISVWSFLLDGVFIGATLSKEMRNTMMFSFFCCFLPTWYYTQQFGNHGLWFSLLIFMLARGISMGWVLRNSQLLFIMPDNQESTGE